MGSGVPQNISFRCARNVPQVEARMTRRHGKMPQKDNNVPHRESNIFYGDGCMSHADGNARRVEGNERHGKGRERQAGLMCRMWKATRHRGKATCGMGRALSGGRKATSCNAAVTLHLRRRCTAALGDRSEGCAFAARVELREDKHCCSRCFRRIIQFNRPLDFPLIAFLTSVLNDVV